jgi:hypothetical protein
LFVVFSKRSFVRITEGFRRKTEGTPSSEIRFFKAELGGDHRRNSKGSPEVIPEEKYESSKQNLVRITGRIPKEVRS